MNEHYRQGFADRCAQYGVNPDELVKTALVGAEAAKRGGKALLKARHLWRGVKGTTGDVFDKTFDFINKHPVLGGMAAGGAVGLPIKMQMDAAREKKENKKDKQE